MQYSKISLKFKSQDKAPFFIGSQIRGALGTALKRVVCINHKYKCAECFANNSCIYYEFYELKNIYHKYRLDYRLGEKDYDFSVFLFENSCLQVPYLVSALYFMLNECGLGRDKIKYRDFSMFVNDENCLKDNKISLPKKITRSIEIKSFCPDIKLSFKTPLRIKKNNIFLRNEDLELKDLILSIYSRQMGILHKNNREFPYEIKGEITSKNLKYLELTRHSNRQKTTMNLGGIMGDMIIKNLNKQSYEVLKLGEILGAGKQCVFGLGKIEVEDINAI